MVDDQPSSLTAGGETSTLGGDPTLPAGEHGRAPTGPTLPSGTALGRYVVLERIGHGGMGVVYAAFDPELDRKVAVKVLKPAEGRSQSAGEDRLLREAQAMARLSHPNVVAVHDVGTLDSGVFLAMEFVDGLDLKRWLAKRPRSWKEVVDVFVQAGRGLAAAHREGLVHRDFKPDNVMVARDGRVRVLDFGLARPTSAAETPPSPESADAIGSGRLSASVTRTGALVGTPAYMAPELHRGGKADAKSDQFAFCVALYESLYRHRPFADDDIATLVIAVTEGEVRPPRGSVEVPAWVHRVVERGLSTEPAARFESMDALLLRLDRDPARSRRRWLGLGAALTAGGLAVGLAVGLGGDDRCGGGSQRLEQVWDGARADAVKAGIDATGLAFAGDTWERVHSGIDAYGEAWADAYRDACEATHVRGEQSEALLDGRMACLERRLAHVDALASVLESADQAAVERAAEAVARLPALDPCSDATALLADVAPPQDAAVAQSVAGLRDRLAAAGTELRAGRPSRARPLLEEIRIEAQALEYLPLRPEVAIQLGAMHDQVGEFAAAERAWKEAAWSALEAGHDEAMLRASTALVGVVGVSLGRREDAKLWREFAQATLERTGRESLDEARLLVEVGRLHEVDGKYADALDAHQRALDLRLSKLDANDPLVADSLAQLAVVQGRLGHPDRSVELFERALEVTRQAYGPTHPRLARANGNMGSALFSLGQHERAIEYMRKAIALGEAAYGPEHPSLALDLANLGSSLSQIGRGEEAIPAYERAISLFEQAHGPDHPNVAQALSNLGIVLGGLARHEQARPLQERALAIAQRELGEDHPFTAHVLNGLGATTRALGDPDRALELHRRALGIVERTLGANHDTAATTHVDIARALLAAGQPEPALVSLERGLELLRAGADDPYELGGVTLLVARTLAQLRRDPDRALDLAREAAEIYRGLGARAADDLAEVEAWIAERG